MEKTSGRRTHMKSRTFVAVCDPHIDFTTPRGRKDDYYASIMAEFEFVLNYAKQNGAEAVLVPGDLFDKPSQSGTVMRDLVVLLRRYGVHLIVTIGQHDVVGHRIDEYPIKSVGLLEAAGLATVLTQGQSTQIGKTTIRGYAFDEPETADFLSGRDGTTSDYGLNFQLALVHASVGPDETMYHQGIAKQNIKSAHLSIFGDIHSGFDEYEFRNGCVAINMGSMGRRSQTDRGRKPVLCRIEIFEEDGYDFDLEYVDIPCQSDEDIFFDLVTEETGKHPAEIFQEEWRKAQLAQDEDPVQRVRRIGTQFEHPQSDIDLVLKHLPLEEAA